MFAVSTEKLVVFTVSTERLEVRVGSVCCKYREVGSKGWQCLL